MLLERSYMLTVAPIQGAGEPFAISVSPFAEEIEKMTTYPRHILELFGIEMPIIQAPGSLSGFAIPADTR